MWYEASFFVAALLTGGLWYLTKQKKTIAKTPEFVAFQRNYLVVYLLAMFADWLQGPYVYKLYSVYGFDKKAIAQLFVCGFLSSMLVGTFVAGLADKFGRKAMCLLYSITYSCSALTKLHNNYRTLMLGRFLSGVSTSLLFSVFESWMVCEHNHRQFDPELLGDTFSIATLGNGLVAVVAGLVSEFIANRFGSVGPFIFSLVPLNLLLFFVYNFWNENYGNSKVESLQSLRHAWSMMVSDCRIVYLGLAQAGFEGAMYTFVFIWNPALDPTMDSGAPLGLIFAVFMICIMGGSFAFTLFTRTGTLERVPFIIHSVAALAMSVAALKLDSEGTVYMAFLTFEFVCGMFFPAYGTLRSSTIPEEARSAVMNFFRIPLNLFVVVILLGANELPTYAIFLLCSGTHLVSLTLYCKFYNQPVRKSSDRVMMMPL